MYRILYVDDEPDLLSLGKLFLQKSGECMVDTRENPLEVLKRDCIPRYDAIISDYQMPEMDGIGFLQEVRARYGSIPFILFTGKGREDVVIQALNEGADFYLQKGGDPKAQFAELLHKVRVAVERKKTLETLRETTEYLEKLIDYANTPIIVWDPSFRITRINHALSDRTGIAVQDARGLAVDSLFPKKTRDPSMEQVQATLLGTRWENARIPIQHTNGEIRQLLWNSASIYDASGNVTAVIAQGTDITDTIRAEEVRDTYELRLASVMEAGNIAWWEMDLPGGEVRFDPRKAQVLGYEPDLFRNYMDFCDLLHPDDLTVAMTAMQDHLDGKKPLYEVQYRIQTAGGGYLWFRDIGRVTRTDDEGRPMTVSGIVLDISEEKKTEMTLKEEETLLHTILAMSPGMITLYDCVDRKTLYTNLGARRWFGYS